MRILLVEDEKRIASFIERGLKEEGFVVDHVLEGKKALELADLYPYDVIILDVMLPGQDGVDVCRKMRETKINAPILMLTAKNAVKDKVTGLNAGADDYLAKPFEFDELIARLRALIRRKNNVSKTKLKVADLELAALTHQVRRAGKEIPLTNKEYTLLHYLMINANQVVTRTTSETGLGLHIALTIAKIHEGRRMVKILLIDDDTHLQSTYAKFLRDEGYEVVPSARRKVQTPRT